MSADIRTLTVGRGGIMHPPEYGEQLPVGYDLRIVLYLHGLSVASSSCANLCVGRIGSSPSGISHFCFQHPANLLKASFHPPEAACGKCGQLIVWIVLPGTLHMPRSSLILPEEAEILSVALQFQILSRYKAEGCGVDAITQSCRPRTIIEHMAQMGICVFAANLNPPHIIAGVDVLNDAILLQGLCEARPAGTGVELIFRTEQGFS